MGWSLDRGRESERTMLTARNQCKPIGGSIFKRWRNSQRCIPQPAFRALLSLFMVSDPWPLSDPDHTAMEALLNAESKRLGYDNWVDAYHLEPLNTEDLRR